MNFREKVRRVFRRSSSSSSSSKSKGNGIKIEYYKRHEIPRSKFKGPFDREHQRSLAAWSFQGTQAERRRSLDLSLSPCTSLPDYLRPQCDEEDLAPDQIPTTAPEVDVTTASLSVDHDEYAPGRQGDSSGSTSSTAVDPESYSESLMTLLPELEQEDPIALLKETIRYTSPVVRAISPPPMSPKGACMPFAPEDLTRALNAVQICY
ncbi:hypothetical protein ASPACDRAFT_45397 [Aspergillus aculeatus ATCC 16872]|uniref:Uncharacterized protein n=1 Tax=Aspergillus aculeatus (strain ATCC 16872 / CBS 172.66 / WB 5094) TaxID=690307 RepID=A0A1L9WPJ8_ASPA1|nr:uncharacterized protein ASPACDRAFT_45397 [Aspergillus aculeatus ATCC 16872]OJJ98098.1 hypothetical protein ASPACDRAFT_45397 [Aspergillus aculeatus ATCC 16872]